ncbi:MAG: antitoxin Xre/MbcA/ParS toxin-binding domain-containing protein [Candidatus Eisenbacteria bacterium]
MNACGIADVLGGEKVLGWKVKNAMDLVALSKRGVPKGALSRLAKILGFTTPRMASLLPVTQRTIQRYRPKQYFKAYVSEKILELAALAAYGLEIFDDQEQFIGWLNEPIRALGNRAPVDLLDTSFGVEMVRNELIRIEYGVFS